MSEWKHRAEYEAEMRRTMERAEQIVNALERSDVKGAMNPLELVGALNALVINTVGGFMRPESIERATLGAQECIDRALNSNEPWGVVIVKAATLISFAIMEMHVVLGEMREAHCDVEARDTVDYSRLSAGILAQITGEQR